MAFLEVKNIYKDFDNTEVLKGISFSVEKGEVVAIIGSSGSGKTTLLRCLNFLERPEQGEIFVNGKLIFNALEKESKGEEMREKRLHFGLVFQSFNLFPHYSVKGNIELASKLKLKDDLKQVKKQLKSDVKNKKINIIELKETLSALKKEQLDFLDTQAMKLLKKVGLESKVAAYPCELSGGQQQRVAIARALALNPDILCFDEPTSALDPELTSEVLKVIKSLKNKETTMIIVTHEMEFAKNVADKIIFMADGIIEEESEPIAFFKKPRSEKAKAFLNKTLEEI
ncbi:MAG: amino acid ABC transporter ATP-binding protein [Clostridia bacterium]